VPRVVVVSDTHELHTSLTPGVMPNGDILVHCGDFTNDGREPFISSFARWLERQPYNHKVVISGNHDLLFEKDPDLAVGILRELCPGVHYLNESGVEIMGLKFWGSPWTPEVPPHISTMTWGFAKKRGQLKEHWDKIPKGLDVLVTHGPPYGGLMGSLGGTLNDGQDVGDTELRDAILEKRPRVHLCGHIHPGYGNRIYKGIRFVNAALYRMDVIHYLSKRPQIFDLEPREGADHGQAS
jgi:Icc-related predicted phosphoesterase